MAWPKGKKRSPDSIAKGILSIEKSRNRRRDFPFVVLQDVVGEFPHIPNIPNAREYYRELYGMIGAAEKSNGKVALALTSRGLVVSQDGERAKASRTQIQKS